MAAYQRAHPRSEPGDRAAASDCATARSDLVSPEHLITSPTAPTQHVANDAPECVRARDRNRGGCQV
jgi:hypothetical protein